MDLGKSTMVTWSAGVAGNANLVAFDGEDIRPIAHFFCDEDRDRAVIASQAFDVMMRRGWTAGTDGVGRGWYVSNRDMMKAIYDDNIPEPKRIWPDPFTALVEADKWYAENIESK